MAKCYNDNRKISKSRKESKKMIDIPELLEIIMVVSFGASWPFNVVKSWKAKTTKGKSLLFLLLIFFGYIAGIAAKLTNETYMANFGEKWYVLVFYCLNFIMVGADLVLYIRNKQLDKKRETEQNSDSEGKI